MRVEKKQKTTQYSLYNIYQCMVCQNLVSCDSMALKFEARDPSFESDLWTQSKPQTTENTLNSLKSIQPDYVRCFPLPKKDHRPPEKRLHLAKIPIFGQRHTQNGRKAL